MQKASKNLGRRANFAPASPQSMADLEFSSNAPPMSSQISPRRKRKWWAVHPCSYLSGNGLRSLGGQPARVGLFTIINPVNPPRSTKETAAYKVEPYVAAADLYAAPPRRLDTAHGLGRLDLSADRGITPGAQT